MRKIKLYLAVSLDGYIATSDGDTSWLHDPDYELPNEDYGYQTFYDSIDTTIMGNKTYEAIMGFDVPFPYSDKKNYVCSLSGNNKNTEFVEFIPGNVVKFVEELRNAEGKDVWLVGGGQLHSLFLMHNLIDQMVVTTMPIVLGEGIQFFEPHPETTKFKLIESVAYENGLVQSTYNVG